ncbi:CAP domain-containing protein [Flavobacterium frigidarium]|uniref:CAP domain-containing protein n=1 Tax=Flavobacterium frigidarium TaxID=99286 RepID=A0ABV4KF28_9FLAO
MKTNILHLILTLSILLIFTSCSSDAMDLIADKASAKSVSYSYNSDEIDTIELINDYRESVGLNRLEKLSFLSVKADEHTNYMIDKAVASHDGFTKRCNEVIKTVSASKVGENVAFNYNLSSKAFDAWLKSSKHKENIEGNFTHIGVAITKSDKTGKKYYTTIFAKI